jgi:hypothetical protein
MLKNIFVNFRKILLMLSIILIRRDNILLLKSDIDFFSTQNGIFEA